MNPEIIIFYIFTGIIIISGFFLATTRNIVHAAFSFLTLLLCVALLFVYAHAEFLAVTQILIYVGGILVLIIFGVMLTSGYTLVKTLGKRFINYLTIFICICLFIFLSTSLVNFTPFKETRQFFPDNYSSSQKIGFNLLTSSLIPFEISGILLLVALIGASMIAGRKEN